MVKTITQILSEMLRVFSMCPNIFDENHSKDISLPLFVCSKKSLPNISKNFSDLPEAQQDLMYAPDAVQEQQVFSNSAA